jgi:alpha-N-acetylglucosaminidase
MSMPAGNGAVCLMIFTQIELDIARKKTFDTEAFDHQIKNWEWQWVNTRKDYPQQTTGNPVTLARHLYQKYRTKTDEAF